MSLVDYQIVLADASFVLSRKLPDSYENTTTAYITIRDLGGSDMLARTSISIPAATTLAAAATAGAKTITVAAGTWVPEETLMIDASADGSSEIRQVESYNSSTKEITFTERLDYSHTNSTAVTHRDMTYTLDASDTGVFSLGKEGSILWDGFSNDYPPIENTCKVVQFDYAPGNIRDYFAMRYEHYDHIVPEHGFDEFYNDALDDLAERFEKYGLEFRKLVSVRDGRRLLLAQIAYLVAIGQGDGWEYERDSMLMEIDRLFIQFKSVRKWDDSDEDGVRDDDEYHKRNKPLPSRLY